MFSDDVPIRWHVNLESSFWLGIDNVSLSLSLSPSNFQVLGAILTGVIFTD